MAAASRACLAAIFVVGCGRIGFEIANEAPSDAVPSDTPAFPCGDLVCLDPTLGTNGIRIFDVDSTPNLSFSIRGLAIQPDGKLVIAGEASPSAGNVDVMVARLLEDGALDETFGVGITGPGTGTPGMVTIDAGSTFDVPTAVALDDDGRIGICGAVGPDVAGRRFLLARLLSDGSRDGTFGTAGVVTDLPSSPMAVDGAVMNNLVLDASGRILAGGQARFTGAGAWNLVGVRVLSDGSRDVTFEGDGDVVIDQTGGDEFGTFAVQLADGRSYFVGSTYVDGIVSFDGLVVRLRSDGTRDPAFGTNGAISAHFGFGLDRFTSMVLDPDGSVVVAGLARSANGTDDFALARYTSAGVLDLDFGNNGSTLVDHEGGTEVARSIARLPDGRLVLAGETKIASMSRTLVAIASANGELESTLVIDDIPAMYSVAVDARGRLVLYGATTEAIAIVRLVVR